MAAAITKGNYMVNDSDDLSPKIFTAFAAFQGWPSSLTWKHIYKLSLQNKYNWERTQRQKPPCELQVVFVTMIARSCRFVIHERAALVLPSANPSEMRSLQCSCLILLFSWSVLWAPSHCLLPQSSWIKYTWCCAKRHSFFFFCTPDLHSFIFLQ